MKVLHYKEKFGCLINEMMRFNILQRNFFHFTTYAQLNIYVVDNVDFSKFVLQYINFIIHRESSAKHIPLHFFLYNSTR